MSKPFTFLAVTFTALCLLGGPSLAAAAPANSGAQPTKSADQEFTYTGQELKTDLLSPIPMVTGIRRTTSKTLIQLRWDFVDRIFKSAERL